MNRRVIEIEWIIRLLDAVRSRRSLWAAKAEEGKAAVLSKIEAKLGYRYSLRARRRSGWLRYGSAAAAVVILLLSARLVSIGLNDEREFQSAGEPIVLVVPEGAMAQVTLPDGTMAILNGGSRLTYPTSFAHIWGACGARFFDVRKKADRPFVVHTRGPTATVLGTRFSCKAYDTDRQASLTLERGFVRVSTAGGRDTVVTPNQQVVVDPTTGEMALRQVDAWDYICRKEEYLVFRGQTLAEIAAVLERRFNVRIRIASDAIREDRYVARFRKQVSLKDILRILCYQRAWSFIYTNPSAELKTERILTLSFRMPIE